jgi:hypothetical protein
MPYSYTIRSSYESGRRCSGGDFGSLDHSGRLMPFWIICATRKGNNYGSHGVVGDEKRGDEGLLPRHLSGLAAGFSKCMAPPFCDFFLSSVGKHATRIEKFHHRIPNQSFKSITVVVIEHKQHACTRSLSDQHVIFHPLPRKTRHLPKATPRSIPPNRPTMSQ